LAATLQKNGVAYSIEEEFMSFNPTFYDDASSKEFAVKISAADFAKVNEILETEARADVAEVDHEHYLYNFTDEELKDLVSKPDEWSPLDHQLAIKILKERGIEISGEELISLIARAWQRCRNRKHLNLSGLYWATSAHC
jgi:hypothetical protein